MLIAAIAIARGLTMHTKSKPLDTPTESLEALRGAGRITLTSTSQR